MTQKEKDKTLLSLIIPVYNVENFLKECLDSIINLSFSDYEIILVNDGSTDKSGKICDSYKDNYNNITVIHKKHEGLTSARNAGLKIARGKYICPIDSDDCVLPNYFIEISNVLKKHPNIDLITFDFNHDISVEWNHNHNFSGYFNKNDIKEKVYSSLLTKNLTSWRTVYKKSLLLKHHCKNNSINYAEDHCYTFECFYYANDIFFINKSLYMHRLTNKNTIMRSNQSIDVLNIYIYLEYLITHLGNKNKIIDKQLIDKLLLEIWKVYYLILENGLWLGGRQILSWNTHSPNIKDVYLISKIIKRNKDIEFDKLVRFFKYKQYKGLKNKFRRFLYGHNIFFPNVLLVWIENKLNNKK